MEAHELRIRNIVEYYIPTDNIGWSETLITWEDLRKLEEQPESFNSEHRPSKITRQRLLDFGFIKSKISEWYHLEDFQIEIVVDENNNFIFCVVNGFVIRHLKYIHQLQNLYFDLTQKELTQKRQNEKRRT